jgi:hypothetical protein
VLQIRLRSPCAVAGSGWYCMATFLTRLQLLQGTQNVHEFLEQFTTLTLQPCPRDPLQAAGRSWQGRPATTSQGLGTAAPAAMRLSVLNCLMY